MRVVPEEKFVDIYERGLHVRYWQEGSGPDIVFIPGGDQSGAVWHEYITAFKDKFRCTTYDPRGIGATRTQNASSASIHAHAEDCVAFVRQVCEQPAIFVGFSFGALVVQELALSFPELTVAGIPIATSARKSGFFKEWEEAEIALAASEQTLPDAFARTHYGALYYPVEVLGDDTLWEQCKRVMADFSGAQTMRPNTEQWRVCLEYDSSDRLSGCSVPLHVIAFSHDLVTPPSRGREIADLVPDGRFYLLPGLGHMSLFGHRPACVIDCIRTILARHGLESVADPEPHPVQHQLPKERKA